MTRRSPKPQKRPVFLAGEGKSEQGYGRWLNKLANELGVPVHIRAEAMQGGDPFDLVKQAISKLASIEKYRSRFSIKGLLLDNDLIGQNQERDDRAIRLAYEKNIRLIWQKPTHEVFLLRHFSKSQAGRQLKNVWPNYKKGMDATYYEKILTLDHLVRAREAEQELNAFLTAMGWH